MKSNTLVLIVSRKWRVFSRLLEASNTDNMMPMVAPTKAHMIKPIQKFIKYLQILRSHLIGVFGIKLKTLRTLYLISFSFQIILHGKVAMDKLNCEQRAGF
jgi:hypothetical protein